MFQYRRGVEAIAAHLKRTVDEVRIFALYGGLPLFLSRDGLRVFASKAMLDRWKKDGPCHPKRETPAKRRALIAKAFSNALNTGGEHAYG